MVKTSPSPKGSCQIVAIGASTGGPGALVELLKDLPCDFPIPVVVAQHIETNFLEGLVKWISTLLKIGVGIAEEGRTLKPGHIYFARTVGQLNITNELRAHYVVADETQLYTPNIDLFFASLAKCQIQGIAILLTGMGQDGAIGLKALADNGWRTFVQKRDSCVVSGMPSAALKISAKHIEGTPFALSGFLKTEGLLNTRRTDASK